MADNEEYKDEYQFSDLDAPISADNEPGVESDNETPVESAPGFIDPDQNNVKRNAVIAIVLVVLFMFLYKILGSVFSDHKSDINANKSPAITPVQTQPVVQVAPQIAPEPAAAPVASTSQMAQKLSALEISQQTVQQDISSVTDQLGTINTNLNALVTKMAEINGVITNLSAKVDEQSHEVEQIMMRREASKKQHHALRKHVDYPRYHIQAVIPGRAWLIATNGATLTVREGTMISGYGIVKMIDPNQGRVTTSTGQVIRFDQDDS